MATAVCVLSCVVGWLVVETGQSGAASVSGAQSSVTTAMAGTVWPPHQAGDGSFTDNGTTTDFTMINRTSNHSNTRKRGRSSDEKLKVQLIRFWLKRVTVVILASLGLVGNIVTIVVWHRETSFKVTVFLFQFLAGCDSIYLLSAGALMFDTYKPSDPMVFVYHLANFAQLSSVNITLVIAITRWIAVTKPLHAQDLLTPKRIYVSCVLVLLYCGILETFSKIFESEQPGIFVAKRIIGLALPLLLLLIFNLSLLWNATRKTRGLEEVEMHERRSLRHGKPEGQCFPPSHQTIRGAAAAGESPTPETCVNQQTWNGHQNQPQQQKEQPQHQREPQLYQQQQQQEQQQQKETAQPYQQQPKPPPQQQRPSQQQEQKQTHTDGRNQCNCGGRSVVQQQQRRRQQMVTAILLISLCSFIAYPIGVSIQAYAYVQMPNLDAPLAVILGVVPFLLHILNSSINIVIYSLFVSRFRELAKVLRQRLSAQL